MILRFLYTILAFMAAPVVPLLMFHRKRQGREDPDRISERYGCPGLVRPDGPLVWIHAASNGESMSALPLIDRILQRDPACHVLVTTVTVTSADLMSRHLPDRAIHQYAPLDCVSWVRSFLAYWKPDLGIWIESEFWPNLIWEMQASGKPIALVNGRISHKSLKRWRYIPGFFSGLVERFSPCLTQTPEDATLLQEIGSVRAECVGNIKRSGPPLPVDEAKLEILEKTVSGRPFWLAASTHPEEEELIVNAYAILQKDHPALITCIVPRHPLRGTEMTRRLRQRGCLVAQRSQGEDINADTQIYIADTLGELGLFYRLADIVLIGGSLAGGHGGHNPVEAAHLGCAILSGPDMANFTTVKEDLAKANACMEVVDCDHLANTVHDLLNHPEHSQYMAEAALHVAQDGMETVERVLEKLIPVLPAISGQNQTGSPS